MKRERAQVFGRAVMCVDVIIDSHKKRHHKLLHSRYLVSASYRIHEVPSFGMRIIHDSQNSKGIISPRLTS